MGARHKLTLTSFFSKFYNIEETNILIIFHLGIYGLQQIHRAFSDSAGRAALEFMEASTVPHIFIYVAILEMKLQAIVSIFEFRRMIGYSVSPFLNSLLTTKPYLMK